MEFEIIAILLFAAVSISAVGLGIYFYFTSQNRIEEEKSTIEDSGLSKNEKFKMISEHSLEILKMEFEYASKTSIQANEDRLTILNYFITLFTGASALVVALNEVVDENIAKYLPVGFILISVIAAVFIVKIIRLRQAWYSSVEVMNQIKEYFIEMNPNLGNYLKWRIYTIPKAEKFKTLSFLSSLLISILGTASLAFGLILLDIPILLIALLALLYFVLANAMYYFFLSLNL